LFGCRGLYGGVAAIEGDRWNVAFSVPADRLRRHHGNLGALFEGIARENPVLWRRVRGAKLAGEWIAAPLPRFGVKDAWPAGVTPIGNAAAAIEPIGGEGMGLALRSAELAVESLIEGLDREPVLLERESSVGGPTGRRPNGKDLRWEFRSLWRRRRSACRAGAIVTSRPLLARMLVPMLTNPIISDSTLRLIGKV
jgi:flavin-dependent dehydrogenase